MKQAFFTVLSALLLVVTGCTKKDDTVVLEEGTTPVLSATVRTNDTIPMAFANAAANAIRFNWTAPNYSYSTGPVSQDITYQLEVDTAGSNFTNPDRKVFSISRDVNRTLTQGELNDALLNQLRLVPDINHTIEVRLSSSIGSTPGTQLYSNVLTFNVRPFSTPPKVNPPASNELFITGSATDGGWMADNAPPVAAQKFTRVSNTQYEISSVHLNGGGEFLLVPVYGNWSSKYGFTGAGAANNVNGDEFKAQGENFKAPAASGNYKIVVDFQRGKYTVTPI